MKNRTDFVSLGVKEQLVQAVRNQWEAARAVLWALLGLVVGLGNMMRRCARRFRSKIWSRRRWAARWAVCCSPGW